jgi:hypothetical protein
MVKQEVRHYAGEVWDGLERQVNELKRRATGRLDSQAMNRAADQLFMLYGAMNSVIKMAELVRAERKRSLEWALKNATSAALVLGSFPGVDSGERNALYERLNRVPPLLDVRSLDEAEWELENLEAQMDELRMKVIDRRVGDLLDAVQGVQ